MQNSMLRDPDSHLLRMLQQLDSSVRSTFSPPTNNNRLAF